MSSVHYSSRSLMDPASGLLDYSNQLAMLGTLQDILRPSQLPEKEYTLVADSLSRALNSLRDKQKEQDDQREKYASSRVRVVSHRDYDELDYIDHPVRAKSIERSESSFTRK